MTARLIRVVSLWVHPGQEAAFEAFEREAARIMARHGGRIDQAIRLDATAEEARESPFEIHIVSFPDEAAFDAYRTDSDVLALRERRDRIVARTEIAVGRPAGPY
jgi:hypothetical protein